MILPTNNVKAIDPVGSKKIAHLTFEVLYIYVDYLVSPKLATSTTSNVVI